MKEPTFDIFSGKANENPVWLQAVTGLSNARARMNEIASRVPGEYFVFYPETRTVLAQVETFPKQREQSKSASA